MAGNILLGLFGLIIFVFGIYMFYSARKEKETFAKVFGYVWAGFFFVLGPALAFFVIF